MLCSSRQKLSGHIREYEFVTQTNRPSRQDTHQSSRSKWLLRGCSSLRPTNDTLMRQNSTATRSRPALSHPNLGVHPDFIPGSHLISLHHTKPHRKEMIFNDEIHHLHPCFCRRHRLLRMSAGHTRRFVPRRFLVLPLLPRG